MNQFKLTADDTSRVVDVLVNASAAGRGTASEFAEGLKYVGTMASSMGLSLEETVTALVALNNSGLEATTAGRYLAGMLSDLTEKGRGIIPTWDNFNNLIRQGKISMEDAIAIFDKLAPSLGLSKLASEDLEKAWHELTNAVEEGRITQDQIAEALKKAGFEVNKLGFEIYNADDESTLEEEFRSWAVKEGRWGLGCPNNCGRFWTFKPTEDLTSFEPEDPAAKNPYTDRNGNMHNGYLEWTPQSDGSVIFKCDNCGAEIKLTV
jgi:hypothetical protein